MLHRFLITAKELEILYSLVSTDYLVSMHVRGVFGTAGMVRLELIHLIDGRHDAANIDKQC